MSNQKIQITITPQEAKALSVRGKRLGYSVTKYVKYLVSQEADKVMEIYPTYELHPKLEKMAIKAFSDHKKGKSIKIDNLDDIDNL